MSTILEALRKLEREHSQHSSARSLREAVAGGAAAEEAPEPARWRMPLVMLLLGAGLGAGLLLLWGGEPDAPDPEAVEAVQATVQREAPRARLETVPAPTLVPVPRQTSPPQPVPDVAVLQRPPAPTRSPIAWSTGRANGAEPAAPVPTEERPPSPGPAAVAPRPTALAPPPRVPPRAPSVAAVAAPETARVPRTTPRETPLSVDVERTFWHPKAERRVAIVRLTGSDESLPLQEGEQLGGFTVQRIEPSRVIFEREGIEVARPLEAR